MSFNPSDPAVQGQILSKLAALSTTTGVQQAAVAAKRTQDYVNMEAQKLFSAYTSQPAIVNSNQIAELSNYHNILSVRQAAITDAISTLTYDLQNASSIHISSIPNLSTLLAEPYVPPALYRYNILSSFNAPRHFRPF
jgi:hypothetical protein